ncbi:MAG: ABC transporter ATP-binding protein [Spirulinaceae cyanobacterium]
MAKVVLENVYKSFPGSREKTTAKSASKQLNIEEASSKSNAVSVLRRINLTVEDGEFMVLVGPSGCGKSTLLRVIAGLEELTGGNISVGSSLVNDLPPKQRDIAMVFQNYALYPHLTVYDNIAFGLRRMSPEANQGFQDWGKKLIQGMARSLPKRLGYRLAQEKVIEERVQNVAELLQIDSLLNRLPKQLSGGQKQRVALGRAIARNPQVFLMDEPLSNLDAKLRSETRSQIVKLQKQLGTTTIYVTHDQTEAMTMGDRIAVMNKGEIQQIAKPLEIYDHPVNRFVAEFIGSPPMNFLLVDVKAPLLITHPQFRLTLPEVWQESLQPYNGRSLLLGVRPEDFVVSVPATKNLLVQIDLVEALGNDTYLIVHLVNGVKAPLQVRISPDHTVRNGESLWLSINLEKVHLFDPQTSQAIQ